MKIGITEIYEDEESFFFPAEIEIRGSEEIYFDTCYFDFEIWEDFLDFCDFQEYDFFIFVSEGRRIIEVCKYLNTYLGDSIFSVYNSKMELVFGSCELEKGTLTRIKSKPNSILTGDTDYGSYTYITGIYPPGVSGDALKHIYLEDNSLLCLVDSDLFVKSAINSAIIMPKVPDNMISMPFILLNTSYVDREQYQVLNTIKLRDSISDFISTGTVIPYKRKGVIDFQNVLSEANVNRLFITKQGIYSDFLMKNKVCEVTIPIDVNNIKNKISTNVNKREFTDSQSFVFNLASTLGFYLELGEMKAVTPYNNGLLPPITTKSNNLIGISSDKSHYIYNITNNKLYTSNEKFITLLEFYIKGEINSIEVKKYVENNNVLDEFIRVINKILEE